MPLEINLTMHADNKGQEYGEKIDEILGRKKCGQSSSLG